MIAIEPTEYEPHCTIKEECNESNVPQHKMCALRPILFFSYEGEVAVQGIVTTPPSISGPVRKTSAGNFYLWIMVKSTNCFVFVLTSQKVDNLKRASKYSSLVNIWGDVPNYIYHKILPAMTRGLQPTSL